MEGGELGIGNMRQSHSI